MSSEHNTAVNKDDAKDNTVVVMSQSFLILRSLPVPPGEMKTDQQIARIVRYSLQCKAVQFNPDMTHELWLTSVPIGSHDHFDQVWAKGKSLKKNGSIVTKRQQLTSSYLYFYLQTVPSSQTVMRMLPSRLRLVWRIAVVHWNFDKSILLIWISSHFSLGLSWFTLL